MLRARTFRQLAEFSEWFEQNRGMGRVDVVLGPRGEVVLDLVQTDANDEWVVLQFGDGHARIVPIEAIEQLIVAEDRKKQTPGFTVSETPD